MSNIAAVITPLLSCYFLIRNLKPSGFVETFSTFFCLFTAHIIILGYLLSALNHLSDLNYWSILGVGAALISTAISIKITYTSKQSDAHYNTSPSPRQTQNVDTITGIKQPASLDKTRFIQITAIKDWYVEKTSTFEKVLLTPLMLTTLLLGTFNLGVVVFTAPHNWDSMTYHLVRVAYYLQHNNLTYFEANYWAQVIHPKNSILLLLYTYLISGRNENLTQLVQFIAYLVAVSSIYGISRKTGNNQAQSLFAALVSALLIEWLMQATTTQNDMILTAYLGATIYFLFAFRETRHRKYLALAALGITLSIGTKASFSLFLPSVGLVTLYTLFQVGNRGQGVRNLRFLISCTLLTGTMFVLPAGYIENYHNFGHPIGPEVVRTSHSFEGASIGYIARNGTKNLLRFGFDFLSLDGIPAISLTRKAQSWLKAWPESLVHLLGVNLETTEATRHPFNFQKLPIAHEDNSFWGILGFGLIWIVVILSAVGAIKSTDARVLSVATLLFFLSQAYSGPYDPWRGRYFTAGAIFAAPPIGVWLQAKSRFLRTYLALIIVAGCISAVSAVTFRSNSRLISFNYQEEPPVFARNRVGQLTRNRPDYYEPIQRFDQSVPKDATVAVFLQGDSFEYPLFGEYLTRTLIPINSFKKGLQPIPVEADYLLYSREFPCASPADLHLGANWYLRKLTDRNNKCS